MKPPPMTQDRWTEEALTDQILVANLLLRLKHSDSKRKGKLYSKAIPSCWGNRKNRSKSIAPVGKEQRGSPTTHLSWSGGSGGSTSDESCRPSDLSSGFRSVKANEFVSTSSYKNKSHKRKPFFEIKDEEGSLLKQRMHINKVSLKNQESTSMRINLNQQMSTSQHPKKIKINYGQTAKNKTTSCRVEAKPQDRGFVLPDLNMTPNEDDLLMMMS